MDKVVARLSQRLEAAEAQTTGAIRALEQAFATMDKRLTAAESHGRHQRSGNRALVSVSWRADLSRRVEDSPRRTEDGAAGRPDSILGTGAQCRQCPHRSRRKALRRRPSSAWGQDMVRVAEGLNRRVASVEASGQAALERIASVEATGQDTIRRVSEAVETRFGRGRSQPRPGAGTARRRNRPHFRTAERQAGRIRNAAPPRP
ncbi:MAG: hypothetical protein WDN06_21710 [Asticcacaulis sp.]